MNAHIPQGIEVLVKKASVDSAFKAILLERGPAAAEEIGLRLEPAEAMLLAAAPREQLEAIISRTSVPQEHRRAFLGKVAAAMLAALGAMPVMAGQNRGVGSFGHTADGAIAGIRADLPDNEGPPEKEPEDKKKDEKDDAKTRLKKQVTGIIAKQFRVSQKELKSDTSLLDDLHANSTKLLNLRRQLEKQFKLTIPRKDYAKVRTVGDVIDCIQEAVRRQEADKSKPKPNVSRGIQPDWPMEGSGGIRP